MFRDNAGGTVTTKLKKTARKSRACIPILLVAALTLSRAPFPPREKTTICLAHAAYQLGERFALRNISINFWPAG